MTTPALDALRTLLPLLARDEDRAVTGIFGSDTLDAIDAARAAIEASANSRNEEESMACKSDDDLSDEALWAGIAAGMITPAHIARPTVAEQDQINAESAIRSIYGTPSAPLPNDRCIHPSGPHPMNEFWAIRIFVWNLIAAPQQGENMNHKLDTDQQVFFYEQDFYVLSNFSAFRVKWHGIDFDTSEHAYHWEKFRDHPDAWNAAGSIAEQVRRAPSAHAAFKLAEGCKPRRRPDWDDVKVEIMRGILKAKVDQHEYVRHKLLETGTRELVEDSWRDDFWGWGPNKDGKNMLGRLWMEIREELRAAHQCGIAA